MIQILNPDKEILMDHIAHCRGSVYLYLSDGSTCDLKNDAAVVRLFRTLDIPKNGIRLSLSDPKDFPSFILYLMETRDCSEK